MEPIVSSETSAIRTQTTGNYPERNKLHSCTCFEHYYAHLQEDNCISTVSGIVTIFGWLQYTSYASPHVACVLNSHPKIVTIPVALLIQLSSWRWAQYCSKHVEECNKCIKIKNLCIKLIIKKDYHDMIYSTTTGSTPGGCTTVHIYTQTIHRSTHFTN